MTPIDGRDSAAAVLDVIAMPGQWDQYTRLNAAERLLMAGVVLPANTAFALADSILEQTEKWMQDSDRYLLRCILALRPFVDDPTTGIAKVRDVSAVNQTPISHASASGGLLNFGMLTRGIGSPEDFSS